MIIYEVLLSLLEIDNYWIHLFFIDPSLNYLEYGFSTNPTKKNSEQYN